MRGRSKCDLPLLFALISTVVILQGCITPFPQSRSNYANDIASTSLWKPVNLDTDEFRLRLYFPDQLKPNNQVVIYIEGDGLAWIDRTTPSSDPTPRDPIALRLALAQGSKSAAYIARPCQYTMLADAIRCQSTIWTNARYSKAAVKAIIQAIDYVKALFGAKQVVLVGYSGGGVMAALASAQRDDVSLLVTIAANLDLEFWTRYHGVTPLLGSLDPVDFGKALKQQRQIHFVGSDDRVVPPSVARSYALSVDPTLLRTINLVKDVDHTCCWDKVWQTMARTIIPQR